MPYKRDKNDGKNQAIRRSNMGFLLLLVALACTLLRLGRTGPYREKHLDLLRIDGTFKSENAETWDFGIPYGPMSQRRRHILTNKSTRGISSIGTIGQVPCGRLPRCSPRAVPRALVVADEAPADDDGDTFFTKVWCGWRRVPIWILDFFHQSHQVMDLKSSNRIKELTAN